MNESNLNRMIREHKARIIWFLVFLILAVFVTALVFGTLKRSVQAQTYTKRVFACSYAQEGAEPVAHQHNDDCYENGELICTLPERELHIHGDECYAEEKVLVCTLEEGEGHVHTDACYVEEQVPVCGLEENDGHVHSVENGCYTRVQGDLICTDEDPEHVHTDECYAWEEVLTCEIPEGDGAHHHSEECYETQRILSCGKEEGEGAHTHDDTCYEIQKVLICDKEEVKTEHVHTVDCFQVTDMSPEEIHALHMSELPESDPDADVESPDVWENRFASVPLSGEWDRDLLKIAETQLGYTESQRNFDAVLNEDGDGYTLKGWTRYGAWYGIPYGDWCAMFISFCLNYADIPESAIPYDCATTTWIDSLSARGMYAPAGSYDPKPGDLIFFDWEGDGLSDHVGIVWAVNPGSITTIEGNHTISVELFDYDLSDGHIQGYGILPENPALAVTESEENESGENKNPDDAEGGAASAAGASDGADASNNSNNNVDTENTEKTEPDAETLAKMPPFSYSERVAGMRVTIEADAGAFPEGTTVAITPIEDDGLAEKVAPAVSGQVVKVQAVDITFYDADGNEIEPRIPIRVTMRPFNDTADADNVEVVHMANDGTVSAVKPDESIAQPDKGAAFDANSFSPYMLVYTVNFAFDKDGNVLEYSFAGGTSVSLRTLLVETGIKSEEEVDDYLSQIVSVVFSKPECLEVTKQGNDWLLKSVHAFDTDEKLTVTLNNGIAFAVPVAVTGIEELQLENASISTVDGVFLPENTEGYANVVEDASAAINAVENHIGETEGGADPSVTPAQPADSDKEGPSEENAVAEETIIGEDIPVASAGSTQPDDESGSSNVPSEKPVSDVAYQVFDIGLEIENMDDFGQEFNVSVNLPQEVIGKDFRLYHIHDDTVEEIPVNLVGSSMEGGSQLIKGFEFTTDSFSEFALRYTVDFAYTDANGNLLKWSYPGRGSYPTDGILETIGISGTTESADLKLIQAVDETSDKALYLEEREDGWYLTSDVAFDDTYELTLGVDGRTVKIIVTDAIPENVKVRISFYDYDGTTVATPSAYSGDGSFYLISTTADLNSINGASDDTPYAAVKLEPFPPNSATSYDVTVPGCSADQMSNLKLRLVYTDQDISTLSAAKAVYNRDTGKTFSEIINGGLTGYAFMGDSSAHPSGFVNGKEWDYEINIKKDYINEFDIKLEFEGTPGAIPAEKNYYVLLDATSQDGNNHYYKAVPLVTDGNSQTVYIPVVGEWSNSQKYSENWTNITARIVKPYNGNDLTIPNNCVGEQKYVYAYNLGNFSFEDISKNKAGMLTETDTINHINHNAYAFKLKNTNLTEAIYPDYILGEAVEFGIVADTYRQEGHTETNFAVKEFIGLAGCNIDIDGSGEGAIPIFIGEITNQLWLSEKTKCPIDLFITSGDDDSMSDKDLQDKKVRLTNNEMNPVTIVHMTKDAINAYVQSLIDFGQRRSAQMALETTVKPEHINDNIRVLDFTDYPDNTTIYVDCTDIKDKIVATDGWQIKKRENQSIVFNVPGESVRIGEFKVLVYDHEDELIETVNSTTVALDGNTAINQKVDDVILNHITFNCYDAKTLHTNNASALFLAPVAELVTQENGAGWILAAGTVDSKAEWHYYYHYRKYISVSEGNILRLQKLYEDKDGNPLKYINMGFDFLLTETGSDYITPLQGGWTKLAKTGEDGYVKFQGFEYTMDEENRVENHYYTIKEQPSENAQIIDETTYYIDGVQYCKDVVRIHVIATDNGNNKIECQFFAVDNNGNETQINPQFNVFNYDNGFVNVLATGKAHVEGRKVFEREDGEEYTITQDDIDAYSFTISAVTANAPLPAVKVQKLKSLEDLSFAFDDIEFTSANLNRDENGKPITTVFEYLITESGNRSGDDFAILNDSHRHTVKITVSVDKDDYLKLNTDVKYYIDNNEVTQAPFAAVFTNTYTNETGLKVTKKWVASDGETDISNSTAVTTDKVYFKLGYSYNYGNIISFYDTIYEIDRNADGEWAMVSLPVLSTNPAGIDDHFDGYFVEETNASGAALTNPALIAYDLNGKEISKTKPFAPEEARGQLTIKNTVEATGIQVFKNWNGGQEEAVQIELWRSATGANPSGNGPVTVNVYSNNNDQTQTFTVNTNQFKLTMTSATGNGATLYPKVDVIQANIVTQYDWGPLGSDENIDSRYITTSSDGSTCTITIPEYSDPKNLNYIKIQIHEYTTGDKSWTYQLDEVGELPQTSESTSDAELVSQTGIENPITLSNENSWFYEWQGLAAGYNYFVKEVSVPGYDVSYSNNGGIKKGLITVTNTKAWAADLSIIKEDQSDSTIKLSDVVFTIQELDPKDTGAYLPGSEAVPSAKTDANGETSFSNLKVGSYYEIKEVTPHAGYVLTGNEVFYIKVSSGRIDLIDKDPDKTVENWSVLIESTNPKIQFANQSVTVLNERGVELPNSGGPGTALYGLLGGLMVVTAGAVLTLRKKKNKA